MFKRGFFKISTPDPYFYVRYLGKVETNQPKGRGCTREPVMRIWEKNKGDLRHAKKISLTINLEGLKLHFLDKKKGGDDMIFKIEIVSFCMAEKELPKVFTWIVRSPDTHNLECHAVYCSSQAKAQAVAIVLSRAFAVAFRDWKFDRKRQARTLQREKHFQIAKFISDASERTAEHSSLDECHQDPHEHAVDPHTDEEPPSEGSGCSSSRSEGETDSGGCNTPLFDGVDFGNNLQELETNADVQALVGGDKIEHDWDDLGSEPIGPLTPNCDPDITHAPLFK